MSNTEDAAVGAWICVLLLGIVVVILVAGASIGHKIGLIQGYENGQTDALKGKWEYRLVDAKVIEALPAK